MNLLKLSGVFFVLFLMVSCGPKVIYREKVVQNSGVWPYGESMHFITEIEDTTGLYDLFILVDHSKDYRFENIYYTLEVTYPDDVVIKDTMSIELTDKAGNWSGKCKKDRCELHYPLIEHFRFKQAGKHEFTLNQFTRVDSLAGIYGIGLMISEAEEK